MVCQQLDQLEWDFIQATAESPHLDSLGWTDREFSCLDTILEHKRKGIKANAAFGTMISRLSFRLDYTKNFLRPELFGWIP
jgi:hypothetical protein